MLDSDQTFGVMVLVQSAQSRPVRDAVLKLAETVQTKERPPSPQCEVTNPMESIPLREGSQFTISSVFHILQEVTLDLTRFWETERINQDGGRMLETLLPRLENGCPLNQAAYWLILRLGM
jgi:hypothetical protein